MGSMTATRVTGTGKVRQSRRVIVILFSSSNWNPLTREFTVIILISVPRLTRPHVTCTESHILQLNSVLFSHAITSAIQKEHFDLALEIGPHPALKGPATESIKDVLGSGLHYQGVLERNLTYL
jgi:hypothetical protein